MDVRNTCVREWMNELASALEASSQIRAGDPRSQTDCCEHGAPHPSTAFQCVLLGFPGGSGIHPSSSVSRVALSLARQL